MKASYTILGFAFLMAMGALAPLVAAQNRKPHIGYAYPGGGRRGTTFRIALGGQYLDGAKQAFFSGSGVEAKINGRFKPLNQGQFNRLRQALQKVRDDKKAALTKGSKKGKRQKRTRKKGNAKPVDKRIPPELRRYNVTLEEFEKVTKAQGLKGFTLKRLTDYIKRRRDPKRQPNPQIEERVYLNVTISPAAELGRREVRLQTRGGLTNPIYFNVGQFHEYKEKEPNNINAEAATAGELPITINGQIMPGDVDRFTFTARKGTRLVAASCARELVPYLADAVPGWFQAVMSIYDQSGNRVAYVDDFRHHPDPVLLFKVPLTGKYTIEIRDSVYRGREDFVYRINIGTIPFITSIFPLGGQSGKKTQVKLTGWNLPKSKVSVVSKGIPKSNIPVRTGRGKVLSNELPFMLDNLKELQEVEPNNKPEKAQKIYISQVVNGRIKQPGDIDIFSFRGFAGREIVAEVYARRLSSPVDSYLELVNEKGEVVADNDDYVDKTAGLVTHHADSRICCKLPKSGVYYLRLSDRQHQGGDAFGYRLRLTRHEPGFGLRVIPASLNAISGQSAPITVHVMRWGGFNGDIHLNLVGAPPGFSLSGNWVPEGKDKITLTMRIPNRISNEPVELDLAGTATIKGRKVVRKAVPAEDLMQAFLYRHLVPMEKWLVLKKGNARRGQRPMQILAEKPLRLPVGIKRKIQIKGPPAQFLLRTKLELKLDNPPPGVKIEKTEVTPQGELFIVLSSVAEKLKPGSKGNLLVQVYTIREIKRKNSKAVRVRRTQIGYLPAIPYKAVRASF